MLESKESKESEKTNMPLGHSVLSTDLSLRANMTVEAEINAFDDEYDVRIEELKNEPYFDGTALKIKTSLRVSVSMMNDPQSYIVLETLLDGVEPRKGRYPISRYEFETVETNARNYVIRNLLNERACRIFDAAIVYSHAHFFTDQ